MHMCFNIHVNVLFVQTMCLSISVACIIGIRVHDTESVVLFNIKYNIYSQTLVSVKNAYVLLAIKFRIHTISFIVKYPVENTMAFGGVPTGSKNAKEALRVMGIIKNSG